MYGYCVNCGEDVSELMNWDTINEVIECPNCHHRMIVCYDDSWNEETDEFYDWWWLEEI